LSQITLFTLPNNLLHLGDDIIKLGGLAFGIFPSPLLMVLDLLDLSAYHIFCIAEKLCPIEKHLIFVDKSAFRAKSFTFVD
jgi:hypothetical protein